jgi:hypothetical protein
MENVPKPITRARSPSRLPAVLCRNEEVTALPASRADLNFSAFQEFKSFVTIHAGFLNNFPVYYNLQETILLFIQSSNL